jgi:hypothetical protein
VAVSCEAGNGVNLTETFTWPFERVTGRGGLVEIVRQALLARDARTPLVLITSRGAPGLAVRANLL